MNFSKIIFWLESEYYRLSLWNCIFFIFGVIFYFILEKEPSFYYIFFTFIISLSSLYIRKYNILTLLLSNILIAFCCGLLISKIRISGLNSVSLIDPIKTTIRGEIYSIKHTPKSVQIVLSNVLFASLLMQNQDPKMVRISVQANSIKNIMVGDYIEAYVYLTPPMQSILPGGFDFGLYAYFENIGAVGYSIGKITILDRPKNNLKNLIQNIRIYIYERLISSMGKDEGNVAAAFILGEQGGINRAILQNMRYAGVSHILGIHLSLVAGILYLGLRILLNLSDKIAWNYNIKTISAIMAIFGSGFYLMLSSERIAATRGFIGTVIIMLAVIYNRMPFSRKSLCIAAIIMLSFNPEYVFHPTFQLSFIAVLALIGGFEFYTKNIGILGDSGGIWGKLKIGFYSNIYSTLVAGTSTAPIVLYHFYIMSNYAILANIIILPLVIFVIMPLCVIAVILMPLNLDYYIFVIIGKFIKILIITADFVADSKGSVWYAGYITPSSLLLYLIGLFWLMLWETKVRLYAFFIIFISIIMMFQSPKPDVIFDPKVAFIAVKNKEGKLEITGSHISQFYQTYLNNWFGQKDSIYFENSIENQDNIIETASGKIIAILYSDKIYDADLVIKAKEIESVGAILIFCDKTKCREEYKKNERFMPQNI